jgi:ABC-type transporter Mla subunit MlaD
MSLEEIKESYSNLSPKAIFLTLSIILPAIGGTAYVGITTYNRVIAATEMIEDNKPYDDTELKAEVNALKVQLAAQQTSVNTVKDSMVTTSNQLVSMQEKVSNAIGTANEAKAITNGNVRETAASLMGVREEMKATREGIESQLKSLKRATSNPLGN